MLIGIAWNGTIIFVSPAYGGRASDKEVTLDSGLLDKCDSYDMIQYDKGFDIDVDLAARNLVSDKPPGLRGVTQMSNADVEKTERIAALRIQVEQVIRQIKCFDILGNGNIPVAVLPCLDRIVRVCCAVVNLQPEIYVDCNEWVLMLLAVLIF